MSILETGLHSRSKHLYSWRQGAVILKEALVYSKTDSEIEPPEPDAKVMDPTHEACPAGIFMRQIYLSGGRLMREDSPILFGWLGILSVFTGAVLEYSGCLAS